MSSIALGIDVSKATLNVCLMRTKRHHCDKVFANTPDGHHQLAQWLSQQSVADVHICLEATGQYGYRVAFYLVEHAYAVSIVNPTRIKGFALSLMKRSKSDRIDAQVIAQFCLALEPDLWKPPAQAQQQLQELMRRLSAVESILHQEKNRQEWTTHPSVSESINTHIQQLEQDIERLNQAIAEHFDVHSSLREQQALLVSIPGIAEKTAAHLLAELGDLSRFSHARQLAAYCGLTPREKQSGTSVRKRPCLSKVGNARLRKALFMPAVCATRYNPDLKTFYERLIERGKSKMAAVGAVMRKLLHIVYGVLKHRHPFELNYQQKSAGPVMN